MLYGVSIYEVTLREGLELMETVFSNPSSNCYRKINGDFSLDHRLLDRIGMMVESLRNSMTGDRKKVEPALPSTVGEQNKDKNQLSAEETFNELEKVKREMK